MKVYGLFGPPVVVLVAGFAAPFTLGAAVDAVAPLVVPVPDVAAGVEAGAATGSDVNGVGSGGNGFERMLAIISFMPSSF